jgi:hypothetical protein
MKSRSRIAVWPNAGDVDLTTVERQVMQKWKPPLNLIWT